MLRSIVPALAVLGAAWITGCSASSPSMPASNRGGESSLGGGHFGTSGGSGGVSGRPMVGGGGNAGSVSAGGVGGISAAGAGVGGTSAAGAGGTSAAGTSAGGASAAGAGGTSPVAPPLFSEDFEGATIDAKWTPRINSNPTSVFDLDTNQHHGGKQSLHLKQSGFSSMLAAEGAPIFPAPNNSYYGRVWIRVASDMGGLTKAHVIWVETGDVINDMHEVRVGANLGYFQSNLVPSDTDIRDPQALMTMDTWHCIQFHYGNDLLEVTLDSVRSSISTTNWAATDSVNGNTTPKSNWSPTYAAFRIGWELGSGEVWYDDVALDQVPVPCN